MNASVAEIMHPMCVDADDDQLVTPVVGEQVPHVGALKARVAPLVTFDVVFADRQFVDDLLVPARGQAFAPEVGGSRGARGAGRLVAP